ncbi:hypothetical protein Tco_0014099 [Tanacetum coccineum]
MATSIEALIAEYASAPIPLSPPPSLLSPLSSPLPFIPSPPLFLPSPTCMDIILEADMLLRKRVRFTAPSYRFEIRESSAAAAARQPEISLFRGTEIITALKEVKEDMTDLSSRQRLDSEEFHTCHQDAQDERALLQAQVSTLRRERRYHRHTAMLVESEARYALQAWSQAMDCNRVEHAEILALRAESRRCMLRKMAQRKTPMTDAAIKQLIAQGVADALADYESNKRSRNGDDSHDSRSGERRTVPSARECMYSDFLKCQPLNFKGTEGVVGLNQWFEKMESVVHISNYTVACQIKFATCTLLGSTLTWWNSHVKTVGHDAAYEMTLMKKGSRKRIYTSYRMMMVIEPSPQSLWLRCHATGDRGEVEPDSEAVLVSDASMGSKPLSEYGVSGVQSGEAEV